MINPKYLVSATIAIAVVLYACSGGSSSSTSGNVPQSGNTSGGNEAQAMFETKCAICHGSDGTAGIGNAANLKTSGLDQAAIQQVIANGKNAMPAFGSQLSDDELQKLAAYVLTLRP